jgi:hypothetical protein
MDFRLTLTAAAPAAAGEEAAGLLAWAGADDDGGGAVAWLPVDPELLEQALAASATPAAQAAAATQFLIMMLPRMTASGEPCRPQRPRLRFGPYRSVTGRARLRFRPRAS